jgi:hypothetical protein
MGWVSSCVSQRGNSPEKFRSVRQRNTGKGAETGIHDGPRQLNLPIANNLSVLWAVPGNVWNRASHCPPEQVRRRDQEQPRARV